MSEVKVTWRASEKLRTQEVVATGNETETTRTFTIDLFDLTPEERQAIVVHLGVDRIGRAKIDMQNTVKFDAEWHGDGLRSQSLYFDAEPTVQQIIEWIVDCQSAKAESKAHQAKVNDEKLEETNRKAALYDEYRPRVEALVEAKDYDSLGKFAVKGLEDWHPKGKDSLYTLVREARQEIKTERDKAEKATWIAEHGSDRLKRGFERGHDCQRLYVIERAAIEAPGWTVDFNDDATWKDRSCPSTAALNLAEEAEELASRLASSQPKIVWLTKPASNNVPISLPYDGYEDWDEPWEAREAVVLRFLSRYDLVREV